MVQGKYSENDTTNWTPELSRTLNYDLTQARQVDNGEREVERDLTSETNREGFDLSRGGREGFDL